VRRGVPGGRAGSRESGHLLRAIAGAVGIDERTVRRDLAGAAPAAPERSVGKDGKSYPARRRTVDDCRVTARLARSRVRPLRPMPFSALPEPMLARSGRLPTSGSWAYEVKWDGFRAIVSTEGPLRVRSRRAGT
jgi:ATP-dependent DNA ligase